MDFTVGNDVDFIFLHHVVELISCLVEHSGLDHSTLSINQVNAHDLALASSILVIAKWRLFYNTRLEFPVRTELIEALDWHVLITLREVVWSNMGWLFFTQVDVVHLDFDGCGTLSLIGGDCDVSVVREPSLLKIFVVIFRGANCCSQVCSDQLNCVLDDQHSVRKRGGNQDFSKVLTVFG